MKADNEIGIIIPVYNEGENIITTFAEIEKKVKINNHILVIYDTDNDNTIPLVQQWQQNHYNINLIKNRYGKGVLNAIKTGFETIPEDIVLVVMADLSDDLIIVNKMFDKIIAGYHVVCGSRYMAAGKQIGGPFLKKTLSRLAGLSLYYLTNIPTHDITNSFKMYDKKVINNIEIESKGGFEIGMEIVIKAFLRGYQITEVPSTWQERSSGKSNFKLWQWLPKYLYWYFYLLKKTLEKNWQSFN